MTRRGTPLSPTLLLASAQALAGTTRDHLAGNSDIAQVRVPGAAWHTAFIHYAGFWSHYDMSRGASSWPLPVDSDSSTLWEFACASGLDSADDPQPGEIFLLWDAGAQRFVHSGIVACVDTTDEFDDGTPYISCDTVEGNIGAAGALGGASVHRWRRNLCPDRGDRFIRWVDLDGRGDRMPRLRGADVCARRMLPVVPTLPRAA